MEQIEQYIDEMYDNMKQFSRELNELPSTSENNQDNIMLQDIITKNEIAAILLRSRSECLSLREDNVSSKFSSVVPLSRREHTIFRSRRSYSSVSIS